MNGQISQNEDRNSEHQKSEDAATSDLAQIEYPLFSGSTISTFADREERAFKLLDELEMDFEKGVKVTRDGNGVYSQETQEFLLKNPLAVLKIAAAAMAQQMLDQDFDQKEAVNLAHQIISKELPGILPALGKLVTLEHLEVLANIAGTVRSEWRETLFTFNLRAAATLHGDPISAQDLQGYANVLLTDYQRFHEDARFASLNLVSRAMNSLGDNPAPERFSANLLSVEKLKTDIEKIGCKAHHLDYWIVPWIAHTNQTSQQPVEIEQFFSRILDFTHSMITLGSDVASAGLNIILNNLPNCWRGDFSIGKFDQYLTSITEATRELVPYGSEAARHVIPAMMKNAHIRFEEYSAHTKKLARLRDLNSIPPNRLALNEGQILVEDILENIVPHLFRQREATQITPELTDKFVSAILNAPRSIYIHPECSVSDFDEIIQITGDDFTPEYYADIANSYSSVLETSHMLKASYLTEAFRFAITGFEHRNWDDVELCSNVCQNIEKFIRFLETCSADQVPPYTLDDISTNLDLAEKVINHYKSWEAREYQQLDYVNDQTN
jgi:hypothetical protein